jgi:hypothetical protein
MSGAIKGTGLEADIPSKSFPFFIECKDDKSSQFWRWWQKANSESGSKPPIIVWKKENAYCFFLFSDLLKLMTKGFIMKEKIKKPEKSKKLSLEETSGLQFAKIKMLGRKKKSS